jgi:hypothetical protein
VIGWGSILAIGRSSMARRLAMAALLLAASGAHGFSSALPVQPSQPLVPPSQRIRCMVDSGADEKPRDQRFVKAFGYFFLFSNLAPAFGNALGRLGLWNPPPINLLTAVANNAMDEAMLAGEIPKLMATAYGQGIWADLLKEYYASGETTEFLTKAGGICAQHSNWCEGIIIP